MYSTPLSFTQGAISHVFLPSEAAAVKSDKRDENLVVHPDIVFSCLHNLYEMTFWVSVHFYLGVGVTSSS